MKTKSVIKTRKTKTKTNKHISNTILTKRIKKNCLIVTVIHLIIIKPKKENKNKNIETFILCKHN